MATSCGIAPFTIGGECSGQGVCAFSPLYNRSVCTCNDGWTGQADFQVVSSLVDCHINIPTIIALWSFNLAVVVLSLLKEIPLFLFLYRRHVKMADLARSRGKSYPLWHNKGLFSLISAFVVAVPCMIVVACLKIAYPSTQVIGKDWGISIIWLLCRAAIYAGVYAYQGSLLDSILKTQRDADNILRMNTRFSILLYVSILVVQLVVLVPLISDVDPFNPVQGWASMIILNLHMAIIMVIQCLQSVYLGRTLDAVLMQSYATSKNEKTLRIKEKLTAFQKTSFIQQVLQGLVNLVFGAVPYMLGSYQYMLPVTWLTPSIIFIRALTSITHDQQEKDARGEGDDTTGSESGKRKSVLGMEGGQKKGSAPSAPNSRKSQTDSAFGDARRASQPHEQAIVTEKPPPTPQNPGVNRGQVTFD